MNLTEEFPRSPKERMAGLVHIPRMVDKAHAARQNTLGEYIYPCPLDIIMLEFIRIGAETFQQKACDDSEEALSNWIAAQCQDRSQDEKTAVNHKIMDGKPDDPDTWKIFNELRDKVDSSRTDITTWVDLIDLDEGRH